MLSTYLDREHNKGSWVNVASFGAVGDDRHDDWRAFDDALKAASDGTEGTDSPQGNVFVPPGIYRITRPLEMPQEIGMFGSGHRFASIIKPVGCAFMKLDGANYLGGFGFRMLFRDFMVHCELVPANTKVIELFNCYSIIFDRIRIHSLPDNGSTGFSIINCNDCDLIKPIVFSRVPHVNGTVGINLETTDTGHLNSVKIYSPDIETCSIGIRHHAGTFGNVAIFAPYMENNTIGIDCSGFNVNNGGFTTIEGGAIFTPGVAGQKGIQIADGTKTSVINTRLSFDPPAIDFNSVSVGSQLLWYDSNTGRLYQGLTTGIGQISPAILRVI